jgi:hypothetical protein
MTCSELHPEIALLVGGELPPERLPAVEGHLKTCAACRELATALRADRRALHDLTGEPVDHAVLDRIRGRVSAAVAAERDAQQRRAIARSRRNRTLMALAAGLAALGLALVVWLSPLRTRPGTTRQADVQSPPAAERSGGPGREAPPAPDRATTPAREGTPREAPGATTPTRRPRPAEAPAPAPAPADRSTGPAVESEPPSDQIAERMVGVGASPAPPVSPEDAGPPAPPADDRVVAERENPSITIRIVSDDPDIVFYWLVDEPKEVPDDAAV